MGFHFGLIDTLDPKVSLYAFIGVISFVIVFEYGIGILEYFLEVHPLYNRIAQVIYKELMLMGIISFSIIMYEAKNTSPTEDQLNIIKSIDFAHIILFYVTIFSFCMLYIWLECPSISFVNIVNLQFIP